MEMISHLHGMKTGIKHLYCLEKKEIEMVVVTPHSLIQELSDF